MKVKYIKGKKENFLVEDNSIDLTPGAIYEVLEITKKFGFYRVIDDSGEDYCYPPNFFEIVEE